MDTNYSDEEAMHVVSFNPFSTGRILKGGGGGGRWAEGQLCLVKDQMKRSWKIKIFGLARDSMHLMHLISR
jgi:hypothetical protein